MLDGYKTYLGIVIAFLGYIGLADLFSETELAKAIDGGMQLIGFAVAVYGRYKVKK